MNFKKYNIKEIFISQGKYMHTIKLKVHDDIYNHIIFLLNSLDKKKIEIVEEKPFNNK